MSASESRVNSQEGACSWLLSSFPLPRTNSKTSAPSRQPTRSIQAKDHPRLSFKVLWLISRDPGTSLKPGVVNVGLFPVLQPAHVLQTNKQTGEWPSLRSSSWFGHGHRESRSFSHELKKLEHLYPFGLVVYLRERKIGVGSKGVQPPNLRIWLEP